MFGDIVIKKNCCCVEDDQRECLINTKPTVYMYTKALLIGFYVSLFSLQEYN